MKVILSIPFLRDKQLESEEHIELEERKEYRESKRGHLFILGKK